MLLGARMAWTAGASGVFGPPLGYGRVEGDLDVLLVDPLLDLGGGGQRPLVGLEQRV